MTVAGLTEAGSVSGQLTHALDASGIAYVLLSDPSNIDGPGHDIDIGTTDASKLLAVICAFADAGDLRLVNVIAHATGLRCELARHCDDGTVEHVAGPDLIEILPPAMDRVVTMADMLAARRDSSTGWPIPASEHGFLYVLCKRLAETRLDSVACRRLASLWRDAPDATQVLVDRTLPNTTARAVAHAAKMDRWEDLTRERLGVVLTAKARWKRCIQITRLWRRIREPAGWTIAVLGVDGAGKTTLIHRVATELGPVFRGAQTFHLTTPTNLGQNRSAPKSDPHAAPPRGLAGSIVKILWLWLSFHRHICLRVWPSRVRGQLVLHDRYFHDLLVDPGRYRYAGPMWLAKTLANWLPRPDCWIVLDAPVATILARKSEVAPEIAEQQRVAYELLGGRLPDAIVVDATANSENVAGSVFAALLVLLERRVGDRLGKPR